MVVDVQDGGGTGLERGRGLPEPWPGGWLSREDTHKGVLLLPFPEGSRRPRDGKQQGEPVWGPAGHPNVPH